MGTRYGRLGEAVIVGARSLCFGVEIGRIGKPLHTTVLLYKSGV